jgi:hypothetical protein
VDDLSALGRLERHDHFHRFDLDVRLSGSHFGAVLLKVANDLSGDVRSEFGRIKYSRPVNVKKRSQLVKIAPMIRIRIATPSEELTSKWWLHRQPNVIQEALPFQECGESLLQTWQQALPQQSV